MTTTEDRLTVLVAEDDENDVFLLRRAFKKFGTIKQIIWESDGERARAYLKGDVPYENRKEYPIPDLLILDQRLPGLDGLEVLRWLRRQARFDRLPVVVWSVFAPGQEIVVQRLNAACCTKAVDYQEMCEAMGEAMVCAFRMASLIPEGAWFRSSEPTLDAVQRPGSGNPAEGPPLTRRNA